MWDIAILRLLLKKFVRHPFGFGLSYTAFEIKTEKAEITEGAVKLSVSVKNIGSYKGKEVIEVYCEAPQGKGSARRRECFAVLKKTEGSLDRRKSRLIEIAQRIGVAPY